MKLRLAALIVGVAFTNPAQIWYTSNGTGAVKRKLADKLSDFVNVKDYGALCDGVTDDGPALSTMITTFGTTPSTIIVPGPCKSNSNLTFPSTLPIRFENQGRFLGTGVFVFTTLISTILPQTVQQAGDGRLPGAAGPYLVQSMPFDTPGCQPSVSGLTYSRTGAISTEFGSNTFLLCQANEAPIGGYGLLVAEARTNLLNKTDAFDDATWVKATIGSTAPTVSANVKSSPYHDQSADAVTFGATTGTGQTSNMCQSFTATAAAHTFAVYLKQNSGANQNLYIELTDDSTTSTSALCPLGGLFTKCSVTATLTAATWKACIGPDTRSFTTQPASQGAGTLTLWGASVVKSPWPSTYIPNAGGPGTPTISWTNPFTAAMTSWCVDFVVTPEGNKTWTNDSFLLGTGASLAAANSWNLRAFTDGKIYFDVYDSGAAQKRVSATHGFAAGRAARITACDDNGTQYLSFDGVAATVASSGAGTGIVTTPAATIVPNPYGQTAAGFWLRQFRAFRIGNPALIPAMRSRIMAFGDSITMGSISLGADPAAVYPWPEGYQLLTGHSVRNFGNGGALTSGILGVFNATQTSKEDTIVVLGGTNDLLNSLTANTAFANLKSIYDTAIANGQLVVALTIPPLRNAAGWAAPMQNETLSLNAQILNYCAANQTKMACVDVYSDVIDGSTGMTRSIYDAGDHIHLTQLGYHRVAALVASAVP